MEALVCDMCGGRLTMGAGGIATCDSCGMQYSSARLKEKIQEIRGTVQIDRSNQTGSFLEMARSARKAGNNTEAEAYANKVIEIEPTNYEAWLIKGQAAAWQSSLGRPRVKEGVQFIAKGINYAPDELKQSLCVAAESDIGNVLQAMNSLRAERFQKWPDGDEAKEWMDELLGYSDIILLFVQLAQYAMDRSKIVNPIAKSVEQTVISAWNKCQSEYFPAGCAFADYPDKYRWQTFQEKGGICILMMDAAAAFSNDFDDLIHIYENLINMREYIRESVYWDFKYMYVCEQWHKVPENTYSLYPNAKAVHTNKINEYRQKIAEINVKKAAKQAEEARKRTEAYWNSHQTEKKKYEDERNSLRAEISKKRKEISEIPGKQDIDALQKGIQMLKDQKKLISVFKTKERREIQDQIDSKLARIQAIQDRMDAMKVVIEKEIEPLDRREKAITNELTRSR